MNFAVAMAASYYGPDFLAKVLPRGMQFSREIMQLGSGAAAYYMLDPMQDQTSMIIGAGAGYVGPMVAKNMNM